MVLKNAPAQQKIKEQPLSDKDNQRRRIKRAIFKAAARAEADLVVITCHLRQNKSQ